MTHATVPVLNALTIDVEDYYHVSAHEGAVGVEAWDRYESRVEPNTQRLLAILDARHIKATFFVLGWVGERHPRLVHAIHESGHEIASHGYSHRRIYTQTPADFREETRRAKGHLEDTIGEAVIGYRAASYSITAKSLWALDILREEGFLYDSSIFPIHHDTYGIPEYPRFSHRTNGIRPRGLIEFPLSTLRLAGLNIPIAGGGYFRLFPYPVTRWGIRRVNARDSQPVVFYLHPWEIDPQQPRIASGALSRFRHYVNLHKTEGRLIRLLEDFRFAPMRTVLTHQGLLGDPQRCAASPASCA